MPKTMDCVYGTKVLSKLMENFKFVHCCHANKSRKGQTAKTVVFIMFLDHFFLKEKCSHQSSGKYTGK